MKIGIIGSTGISIEDLTNEYEFKNITVRESIWKYYHGKYKKNEIFLTSRNNFNGSIPPHKVDYNNMMRMFKVMDVDFVFATSNVGSLNLEYKVGEFVVIDQFLDMTKMSPHTVFDENEFAFVDFTEPYCPSIRKYLIKACEELKVDFHKSGCYVGVDGPRYETAAEVRAFGLLGGDIVGMTNVSEAIMARELGLCYASLASITNFGAGLKTEEITRIDNYKQTISNVDRTLGVVKKMLEIVTPYSICKCHHKVDDMLKIEI